MELMWSRLKLRQCQRRHGGWLHESTLPALTWAVSTRFMQPDLVLHECVPGFAANVLSNLLNGRRLAAYVRPIPRG
eukprot:6462235-Amphidinium_carterae.3